MQRKFSAFFSPHTPCRCFGVVLKKCFFPIFFALNSVSLFFRAEKTKFLIAPSSLPRSLLAFFFFFYSFAGREKTFGQNEPPRWLFHLDHEILFPWKRSPGEPLPPAALLAAADGEEGPGERGRPWGTGEGASGVRLGRALKLRCGLEGVEFPS